MKHLKQQSIVFLKGLAIGTADVIPGISGSTVALITGIYSNLLGTIRSINKTAIKLLLTGQWKQLWSHIDGSFLLPLCLGIVISLLTTIHLVNYLLVNYPIEAWSFFLGLSIISCITVYQQIKKFTPSAIFITLIGIASAYIIIKVNPVSTSSNPWFIFIAGALAMSAMILPGISGSFILLILNKYAFMLNALQELNWPILIVFMAGGLLGLLTFSRMLSLLLRNYTNLTIALFAGFMVGSIPKTWPWKAYFPDPRGLASKLVVEQNISPFKFQAIYQKDPHLFQSLGCIVIGCLLVVAIKELGKRKQI